MESIIFHIDVNSAFLSWTALSLLEQGESIDLREIPSIIGGDKEQRHGIVLAKSTYAKSYGIQTGEPIVNAFKKCPSLTMAAPDHNMYRERSKKLMEFLSSICPVIEQVSIDECYMDYSPICHEYSSPIEAANTIKNLIFEKFQFTVNIGISDCKVLAKMASDFQKPNLVHTLFSYEIKEKMWPLTVDNLFMCGHSSVETLHKLGILTIGDLAASEPSILISHLKSHGKTLWEFANGIDNSKVEPLPEKAKGIGNSTTVSRDLETKEEAYKVLMSLAESVGSRLRNEKQKAGMISCEIKYSTFQSVSHQTTLPSPTDSTTLIYETAKILFDELWNYNPIRLLGIRTSKLTDISQPTQLTLFDIMTSDTNSSTSLNEEQYKRKKKQEQLDKALDSIKLKYGKDSIVRGSLLKKK
ncbi:MAG: DNA polymerase IV [Lachnospiraceae bacterium]|nr:DNA polymerase IV [Lachnospiraceae bacterium]